ncbi:NADAR family protein [Streptomyces thinghirensis]|nr:NADAR family protein [Streptomyces thinghirensis]
MHGEDHGGAGFRGGGDHRQQESLIGRVRAGARIKYLCFWGHRPLPDGRIGPSCLSQWWPSPFTVAGVEYATAEHWMMAGKARLFGDAEAERRVLAADHPAEAKKTGRLVRGFDETVWERERFRIVVEGSVHRVRLGPDTARVLAEHGREGAGGGEPRGPVVGHRSDRGRRGGDGPGRWRGPNLLGFALMTAQGRLRAGG